MTGKPLFEIDLARDSQSSLEAHAMLELIDNKVTYHTQHNLRPALGIYNISTSRVLHKVADLCAKHEEYIRLNVANLDHESRSIAERALIDYIELTFYAAADHVDDLELIAKHFYRSAHERSKCPHLKMLSKEIKQHKKFISAVTNYIKHSQHRIRLFFLDYHHSGNKGTFYGYIIESVIDGVVGPSPIFHTENRQIFSVTSLAWAVILFLLRSSRALGAFLQTRTLVIGPAKTRSEQLIDAVIAAARLPLYNLDDDHPFTEATFKIVWDEASRAQASSKLYGSASNRWQASKNIVIGNGGAAFAGDGVTRTFKVIIGPSRVGLQHWQIL